ncbi:MAG: mercuric transporter MerT family protein [Thermoanaerobaculum sp.]
MTHATNTSKVTRKAALAAVLASALAALCCWGPALLVALGLGAAGLSWLAPLEALRPVLLASALGLLAVALWRELRRPAAVCEGEACHPVSRRKARGLLGVAAVTVLGFAAYPYLHGSRPERAGATLKTQELTLEVTGMTCGACARTVQGALEKTPGVARAEVSLAEGKATVWAEKNLEPQALVTAVEKTGYHARMVR